MTIRIDYGDMGLLRFLLLSALAFISIAGTASAQSEYKKSYASDMKAFVKEVKKTYPFFDLKDIRKDWSKLGKRLEKEAKKCKTDTEFIALVQEGVSGLRDAHSYISDCAVELPKSETRYYSGLSLLPATDGRVVVMFSPRGAGASLKAGQVVLKIDGKDAREVLEERAAASWEAGGSFSSPQRALFWEYRYALQGESGTKHKLTVLDGNKKKTVKLSCRTEMGSWAHNYHLPEDLQKVGKSFYHTVLPSGYGYMYLRRVDSSISEGMAVALEASRDVPGWVVDLRGNTGGGYDNELTDLVASIKVPVVAILDAGCISAGETLARDFVNLADAHLIGTTSAGSSSVKTHWPFPSGIATVRISTRSRSGIDGKMIEFHGITPHEIVEAVPEEVQAGLNSEIQRAVEYLGKQ